MLWGCFAVLGPGWLFGCLLSHFKICFNDVVCICCVYLTRVSVTNAQKKKTNKQKQIRMWTVFFHIDVYLNHNHLNYLVSFLMSGMKMFKLPVALVIIKLTLVSAIYLFYGESVDFPLTLHQTRLLSSQVHIVVLHPHLINFSLTLRFLFFEAGLSHSDVKLCKKVLKANMIHGGK